MRADADAAIAEPVLAAWDHAVAHWEDPAAHDELLRLVTVNVCFAWLAAKYKARGDDIAKAQQAKLRSAAEIQLVAGATARRVKEASPYKSLRTIIVMLVLVCVSGLVFAAIEEQLDQPAKKGR